VTPEMETPLPLVLLVAAVCWVGYLIQLRRDAVRRRRAARAALARVLAECREYGAPDDCPLEQQAEYGQYEGNRDEQHEDKLEVLSGRHGLSVSVSRG